MLILGHIGEHAILESSRRDDVMAGDVQRASDGRS